MRAIKGVFVSKGIHPPRDTDLCLLYNGAIVLFPEIEKMGFFIEELNNYCPKKSDPDDISKCRDIADKTLVIVDNIASFLK